MYFKNTIPYAIIIMTNIGQYANICDKGKLISEPSSMTQTGSTTAKSVTQR
jgi:hypothetical protein